MGKPILLIIAAASGTGKSSLAQALVATEPKVALSVSHTTRDIRTGERDGRDYHFVTEGDFKRMIDQNQFIEYAQVYGHFYGTSRKTIEDSLNAKVSMILDIDWQGAKQVKTNFDSAVSVFLLPPSLDALQERLINRKRDSEETIQQRLAVAIEDMRHFVEFDYIVLNDCFESALSDLKKLLKGHKSGIRPLPHGLLNLLCIEPE